MQSTKRLALALSSILILPLLGGCLSVGGQARVTPRPASACSKLIPDGWRKGVPSADVPADDKAASWVKFGDAQTGQLDKANDRTTSSISIVEKCEGRDAEAQATLKPHPWYQFWK